MKTSFKMVIAAAALATGALLQTVNAAPPTTRDDGVTVINLNEYNGYFEAKETIASLKPGKYEFKVTNKAGKLVGFQIQNYTTHETLDVFPIEPGETRSALVDITTEGVRYRCPINPTPWYDIDNVKAAK